MSERAKAKQIQVEASGASTAGTLQELIEDRKIFRPADIDVTPGEYDVVIESSTGTPGTIPAATITKAGAMSKDDKAKVNDLPDAAGLADSLSKKVDKVTGKGLSTNDYTDADKAKLASIESSHFRGVYANEAALATIPDPVAGDYADVDAGAGSDAERWIYDVSDSKWIVQESSSSVTASQVKQLYESNADTNVFSDDDKSILTALKTTVPQAEAEAGTSTDIRAWTAQRVRQAIAAWWNTIGTAFGKTLLGSADASGARQNLELGTTATKDVGTSDGQVPDFVSIGEGLGGFGYGRVGTSVGRYADVNDVPKRTGSYLLTDGHPNSTNNKAPLAGFYDTAILRTSRESTNDFVDLYLPYHQYSNGMVIAPHASGGYAPQRIVSDSVNLRTTTGNSTIYPMSQKAVTDALGSKVDKVQAKEIVTANKTLTAADRGKLLIINSDGITITMPANSNFNIDIAKMDEDFITIVQCAGADKFREDSATISVVRDVSITNSGIAGKEWLAIGAYEV